jgi:hypothetical protein
MNIFLLELIYSKMSKLNAVDFPPGEVEMFSAGNLDTG